MKKVFALAIAGSLLFLGGGSMPSHASPQIDAQLSAQIAAATEKWIAMLNDQQRFDAVRPFSDERGDWTFIPRPQRKGVSFEMMTPAQRAAATEILKLLTSPAGFQDAQMIMKQQGYLKAKSNENPPQCCGRFGVQCSEWDPSKPKSQQSPGCPSLYDPSWYFISVFSLPSNTGEWGLSFEGHHVSLNYTFNGGKITGSTPTAFGSNPAIMMSSDYAPIPKGTRLLTEEDDVAMALMNSFNAEQRKAATMTVPYTSNLWDAGGPQPLGAYPPWG